MTTCDFLNEIDDDGTTEPCTEQAVACFDVQGELMPACDLHLDEDVIENAEFGPLDEIKAAAFRLTPEEWAQNRETVARAMHDDDQLLYMGDRRTSWITLEQVGPGAVDSWRSAADTAMVVLGFTRAD